MSSSASAATLISGPRYSSQKTWNQIGRALVSKSVQGKWQDSTTDVSPHLARFWPWGRKTIFTFAVRWAATSQVPAIQVAEQSRLVSCACPRKANKHKGGPIRPPTTESSISVSPHSHKRLTGCQSAESVADIAHMESTIIAAYIACDETFHRSFRVLPYGQNDIHLSTDANNSHNLNLWRGAHEAGFKSEQERERKDAHFLWGQVGHLMHLILSTATSNGYWVDGWIIKLKNSATET